MGSTAMIFSDVGMGLKAGSQVGAGLEQAAITEQNANSQALDEEYKAQVLNLQATQATEVGEVQETNQRLQTRASIGSEQAELAAQGIDIQTGSALDVVKSMAYQGEVAAQTIRVNAATQAWGYSTQAQNDLYTAATIKAAGSFEAGVETTTGIMSGAGTIIGGAGGILAQKYGFGGSGGGGGGSNTTQTTGGPAQIFS